MCAAATHNNQHHGNGYAGQYVRPKACPPVLIGGDIFEALALLASAVMPGRPALWGLAAYGADGVQCALAMRETEVGRDLGHCGATRNNSPG